MTTFDDRESAHENKFARDNETEFKVVARRNRLIGLWAAEKLHLKPEEQAAYASEVMNIDLDKTMEGGVLRKITNDFEKAGLAIPEKDVREEMHRLLTVAREQIMGS